MCNPKVSIIVPIYNGKKFISDTIQMLLNSSLQEIEIIAIDDGSKDGSADICRKIAVNDERVKLICQNNMGVSSARNHGLQVAQGEYVCFCDQDDVIEQKAYKQMYEIAQKHDCDAVLTSTGKLIGNKRESFEKFPDAFFSGNEIKKNCLLPILFNGTYCFSTDNEVRIENDIWKCMVKREFIDNNKLMFRHFVNYEDDFLFLLDILARAKRVSTISDVLYYWRVNLQSETYNTAYVNDLYAKDIRLQNAIIDIMEIAQIDKKYIDLYEKCQNCNRYMHIIENEYNNKSFNFLIKISNIKCIKKEDVFAESLNIRNVYKNNLIHRKIILFLLERNCFMIAYWFHAIYTILRKTFIRFSFWTRIENFLFHKE